MDFKNIKLKVEYKKLYDLDLYKNNPRIISEEDIKKVMNSIERYGFVNPIIVNSQNVIVCGHTRHAAARRLELEEVPTINIDHLPEELQKEYRIVDNATGALSKWDEEKLELECSTIKIDMQNYGLKIKFGENTLKLPDVNIQGEVDNKGDYIIIQFDTPEECLELKEKLGMKETARVTTYEKIKELWQSK